MSTTRTSNTNPSEVFASAREWELLTGNDQTITINSGIAHAIYCETAGDVIEAVTPKQAAKELPLLQAGMNAFSITSVVGAGTTLAGVTYAVAW